MFSPLHNLFYSSWYFYSFSCRLFHPKVGNPGEPMMTLTTWSFLLPFSRWWRVSPGCSHSTTSRRNQWLSTTFAKPPTWTSQSGFFKEEVAVTVFEWWNSVFSSDRFCIPRYVDFDELERKFWKNLTFNPPLYGADVSGTLYDSVSSIRLNNPNPKSWTIISYCSRINTHQPPPPPPPLLPTV